ncbi:heterokaryon incompatibility, partial [Leptodontidium sp. MPI-SDFR-AT-0119]
YIALSYTWGDPGATVPIFLDDKQYPVTLNLHSFLQHAQSILSAILPYFPAGEDVTTYSDRLFLNFWIDAICIDQNNTQERSAQVARMREIYSKAISPLIWLGVANLPTSDANGVIDLIRDIRVIVEPHLQGNIEWSDVVEKITPESFLTSRIESVREFRKLVGRDWFSRIWIIQEAGTANASSV